MKHIKTLTIIAVMVGFPMLLFASDFDSNSYIDTVNMHIQNRNWGSIISYQQEQYANYPAKAETQIIEYILHYYYYNDYGYVASAPLAIRNTIKDEINNGDIVRSIAMPALVSLTYNNDIYEFASVGIRIMLNKWASSTHSDEEKWEFAIEDGTVPEMYYAEMINLSRPSNLDALYPVMEAIISRALFLHMNLKVQNLDEQEIINTVLNNTPQYAPILNRYLEHYKCDVGYIDNNIILIFYHNKEVSPYPFQNSVIIGSNNSNIINDIIQQRKISKSYQELQNIYPGKWTYGERHNKILLMLK